MNEELKPCPFCCGKAIIIKSHESVDNCSLRPKFVQCTICDTKSKTFCVYNNKLEELDRLCVEAWNNRNIKDDQNYFDKLKECKEKEILIKQQYEYLNDEIKKLNSEISKILSFIGNC